MADAKKNILLLFDRPLEPIFMPKGKTATVFDVPEKFFTERYRNIATELQDAQSNDAVERVPVKDIANMPDLNKPMSLKRDEQFSLFIPKHRDIANSLISIFMGLSSTDELLSVAAYARDRVNPCLFNYALSVALLHRPDTKNLDLPAYVQNFPDKFVDSKTLHKIREEAATVPAGVDTRIIYQRLPPTGSGLDPEHRLWYFREDLGVNSHHWHWHLVYPFDANERSIVAKDRRGELFYYMHEQLLARYNMERLCNGLPCVAKLDNLRSPVQEGYCPKMYSSIAGLAWASHYDHTEIKDLNRQRDNLFLEVGDMQRWHDNIINAIEKGHAENDKGEPKILDETTGIDTLGNMVEASILSPNRDLYGDYHNMGHVILSYVHDPNDRHLEPSGVVGDFATAMRDPVFFRWHAHLNDIFQKHKERLPPYTLAQLQYNGVSIENVEVNTKDDKTKPNELTTFWEKMDVELPTGIDFAPRGEIFIQINRLQHTEFSYVIHYNNDSTEKRKGTVRIFIAPKYDGRGQIMLFNEQRLLMVELDKFVCELNPGKNTIKRLSTESSVTIPFEYTIQKPVPDQDFCKCGWPQNLLIAKGLPEGFACQLFVMISDYNDDKVVQDEGEGCKEAPSYCGLLNQRYPDKRPMGFPFDRLTRPPPKDKDANLESFLTSNMKVIEVKIRHDPNEPK